MSKHIHLIGLGGIGMSSIARILLEQGKVKVSGSDIKDSKILHDLSRLGAEIHIGHNSRNVEGADLIVYSSAISRDNPEIKEAKQCKIRIIKRAQMLAELMRNNRAIAVTGAHGKTTTSSLIAHLLLEAGFSPTISVGGIIRNYDSNALSGKSNFFVAEADESDGSFLYYEPDYSIITNLDYEHLDYYKSFDNLVAAFRRFMDNTKKNGCVICNNEDLNLKKILINFKKKHILYGFSSDADIYARNIEFHGFISSFDCWYNNRLVERFDLSLAGEHNVANALSAIALGIELGIELADIKKTLLTFQGTKRRLEKKMESEGVLVIDDYAHHPTEIKATLHTLSNLNYSRVIVIFQPHRFSRTKLLLNDFGNSFSRADQVIITDIYPAGEEPIEGINSRRILEAIKESGFKNIRYLPKEEIVEHLLRNIHSGDLIATLGAGDITQISDELVKKFSGKNNI